MTGLSMGVGPTPSIKGGAGPTLVSRVLAECLEKEKNRKPVLSTNEEVRIVRLAEVTIMRELSKREDLSISDLSISDFESCSWRQLKLALLIREWQGGSFIAELENLVPRPVGLSDTWFLAGVVQRFLPSGFLARWTPYWLRGGWDCRRMIFRISFPHGVVRLPESEECINRICAYSKLEWWFRQAYTNAHIDEETWMASGQPPTFLMSVKHSMGKKAFDDAIQEMRHHVPPPAHLSNLQYLACLRKYAESTPLKMTKSFRTRNRNDTLPSSSCDPQPSSSSSVPADSITPEAVPSRSLPISSPTSRESAGTNQLVDTNESVGTNQLVDTNESVGTNQLVDTNESVGTNQLVDPEMTAFMVRVLDDCAEKERSEKEVVTAEMRERGKGIILMTHEAKRDLAQFALTSFQGMLSTNKSDVSNRRTGRGKPFSTAGWRWLSLVGLMNDHLEAELLNQVIAESEKIVPRPKHVSPLWYLACRMQTCLKGRQVAPRFSSWLKEPPAWWVFSSAIYRDHFPDEFGELPVSVASARLIAFSSRAAHWIACGLRRFSRRSEPRRRRTSNDDIVDIFHTVLGDRWFGEMINLVKPKISAIAHGPHQGPQQMCELPDKSIMEAVLRHAELDRRMTCGFCRAWQFDVALKRYGNIADPNSSTNDEEPTKRVRSG
ncbi:hypothetical protein GNI_012120 [Gregarina niphandrodes]|uniref:Uncharacterized protein n=1 Tax=Gregarina niphandrodes TaxID=110365 RepID=A0A023BCK5_GRENI|nr:hypothetical protein GNI_012120 [Gregarina niphandrodes]EZG85052.1 hypothetical protein GNI_012120 [Gregarina niphandrodes]|eukprot:XP_011128845.1 hypothetical protein GNI_012120 [Gregarina niphandrodes]